MDRLRILQVIGAMNRAGAETVVMNLYRAIDRDSIQFDFLVHERARCDYDDEIEALGGRIYRIPRYRIANSASYRRICRRFFGEHPEFEVVHGHIGSSSAIYLSEAARAGCSTVVHSHRQNSASALKAGLYTALVRPAVRVADEFLGCSYEAGLDRFGPAVVGGAHFNVMPNGIPVEGYACDGRGHEEAKERLGLSGTPVIGNVGRLVPEKNHAFLLDMYAELLKAVPHARLIVLGRGPLEDELRRRALSLGLDPDGIFRGVRDDVPEHLKAMDAFVFPSLVEGLPMSLVEAQAAGAPCLIADTVPRSAVLCDAARRIPLGAGAPAWAAQVRELLESPPERSRGAEGVRAHGFDIEDVARGMQALYRDLAGRSMRGRAAREGGVPR